MTSEKVKTLCDLPDDILSHMLSFLPTEDAIKTCVLSTRWKYLFMSVPAIVLDDEMILPASMLGFISSVSRLLSRRKVSSKLFMFGITYKEAKHVSLISNLIRDALDCDIEELDIGCSSRALCVPDFALASEIFLSTTLAVLRLYGVAVNVSKLVSLPNLKILELDFVEFFGDDASLERLFVGFRSLDFLMMNYCRMEKARGVLNISLPSLRQLNLYNPYCYRLIIDTPKLEYLTLYSRNNYSTDVVLMKDLQCLVQAELHLFHDGAKSSGLAALFNAMCNVKALILHSFLLPGNIIQPPQFANLTRMVLTLKWWEPMLIILHSSPYLQFLVINVWCGSRQFVVPQNTPICLTRNLSRIEVGNFYFKEMEVKMVGYLLQHGKVLESIMIDVHPKDVPESSWESLLMLPRCSTKCKMFRSLRGRAC